MSTMSDKDMAIMLAYSTVFLCLYIFLIHFVFVQSELKKATFDLIFWGASAFAGLLYATGIMTLWNTGSEGHRYAAGGIVIMSAITGALLQWAL